MTVANPPSGSMNIPDNDDPQYTPPPDDQAVPLQASAPAKAQRPDDSQLAARWIIHNRLSAYGLSEYRKYQDGIWPPVEKEIVKKEVKSICDKAKIEGVQCTSGLVDSVTNLIRLEIFVSSDKWNAHDEFLPCANGVLHIPTKQLLSHTPGIYATSKLSFDYDPAATCPNFMHALQQIPDAAGFLQEFAGYALTPDVKHEIAIWMQGVPGSGKSTIIFGLQTMLGDRAGLLGLADIERSRFALANLPGKTLVVSTEQPDTYIKATDILNSLISGEQIQVEQKYKEAVIVTPHVKIVWSMNTLPRVSDANNGIMRRVKVIPFPALPDSQKDTELKNKIALEGAGILNWALEGLDRLNARGKFIIPQCVVDATNDFKERNDIPALFLEESGAIIKLNDPQCYTQAQDLYSRYSDWCKMNNHRALSSTKLAEDWKRLGFKRVDKNGRRFWEGVEFSAFTTASNVP